MGSDTLTRLVQPEKTLLPILVTLLGIVTLVRLTQSERALSSILETLSGILIFFNVPLQITIFEVNRSELSEIINSLMKQPSKALSLTFFIPSLIVILVRLVQPENA